MNQLRNPELQRNVWTELSTQRLIMMPVIMFLLFIVAYSTGGSDYSYYGNEDHIDRALQRVYYFAYYGFIGLVILWGAKNASDGIVDEYNSRTWDWQRGHRLSPLEMSIGKLFGPTLYNWYAGIICLLVMLFSYQAEANIYIGLLPTLLLLVIAAITVHAVTIITALYLIRRADGRGKIRNMFYIFVAIYFGIQASSMLYAKSGFMTMLFGMNEYRQPEWYFLEYGQWLFVFLAAVWAFWAVLGTVQNFRTEYQYVNGGKVWLLFLGYIVFYYAGFNMDSDRSTLDRIYLLLFASLISFAYLIYTMLILESKDEVMLRRVFGLFSKRNWKEFGRRTPLWLLTFFVFAAGCVLFAVLLLFGDSDFGGGTIMRNIQRHEGSNFTVIGAVFGSLFFVMRDICIFIFTNNFGRARRADSAALLYIVLLYSLMPWLVAEFIGKNAMFLFLPVGNGAGVSWLPALIQAGIMYMLVRGKFSESGHTL